jgi:hypothetical protein
VALRDELGNTLTDGRPGGCSLGHVETMWKRAVDGCFSVGSSPAGTRWAASLSRPAEGGRRIMTWKDLAVFVREHFDGLPLPRNLSIAKQLGKKWGLEETSRLIEGAALLGWKDLRGLQADGGIGLRWARERYWREQNRRTKWKPPTSMKQIFKELAE